MKKRFFLVIVALFALVASLVAPVAVAAQPPEKINVIIGFDRVPGPGEEALVRGVGGSVKYTYNLIPAIAASLPQAAIDGLLRNPNVTIIEPDVKIYAVDAELDDSWGVKRIGAGTVHNTGNSGYGIKIAVIDSGIDYTHPDLIANYAGGWDFVNNDNDPMDDDGHGTHVAGTIAASDDDIGVVGVAPEAELYALKVLGADGSGSYSDVIAALEWAVENGIQITNNSYGSSGDPGTSVQAAFDNAYAAGLLHVGAAGNNGNPPAKGDNVIFPARWDSVIAVAATDANDNRAKWSSTGSDVELAAPGVAINSTLPGASYGSYSGTSMASPHVAGTAALIITSGITDLNNNGFINDEVRQRLTDTVDDLGDTGWDVKYGYGLVNAAVATSTTEPVNQPPVASFTYTTSGLTADFNASGSSDPDGTITSYEWNFGNGATGSGVTINHTYAVAGTYTVTLTVTDDDSATNSSSQDVTVSDATGTMHIGDLDGSINIRGKSGNWNAKVTVTVHDQNHNPVAGATVTIEWSGDITGTASGTTASDGTVLFSTGNMSTGSTVILTVANVEHTTLTYDGMANHDPDEDSDGSSITLNK